MTWRHYLIFLQSSRVSLVNFSYWSKFHVNIITGSQIMTIFVCMRLTRNPEIRNTFAWFLLSIWRPSWVRDTNFPTNVSKVTKCSKMSRVQRFWVIKRKSTGWTEKYWYVLKMLLSNGYQSHYNRNNYFYHPKIYEKRKT